MYVVEILILACLVVNTIESGTKYVPVDVSNACSTSLNVIY